VERELVQVCLVSKDAISEDGIWVDPRKGAIYIRDTKNLLFEAHDSVEALYS
jgi:hypothetical protein